MRLRSGVRTVGAGPQEGKNIPVNEQETTDEGEKRKKESAKNSNEIDTGTDKSKMEILRSSNSNFPVPRNAGKCLCWFLFILYVVIPVFVKTNPWIQSKVVFLNHFCMPYPVHDISNPASFGLESTRQFHIKHGNISLGAWHILPKSLRQQKSPDDKFFEASLSKSKPVVIYLHGNSGTRASGHRVELYKLLSSLEYHVIAFDYRGYADSSYPEPCEEGVAEDANAVFNWVMGKIKNASQIYLWGHSLGSGVATKFARQLCKRGVYPSGLILESAFNNMREAAANYPLGLPFRYLPWFEWVFVDSIEANGIYFASDKNIVDVTIPILILHAEDDLVVSFHLGKKLYQAALDGRPATAKPVQFVAYNYSQGYGHMNIYLDDNLPTLLRTFIR